MLKIKNQALARQAFLENDKNRKLEIAFAAQTMGRYFRKQINKRKQFNPKNDEN